MSDHHTDHTHDRWPEAVTWPTMREAGEMLGLTPNAIRQRIRRGSLVGLKVDGVWRVDVAAGADDHPPATLRPGPQPPPYNQGGAVGDTTTHTTTAETGHPDQAAMVEQLRDENAFLRTELEARRQSEQELRIIIATLTESVKALPSTTSPESFHTSGNASDSAESPVQETTQERPQASWWRRILRLD